MVNLERITATYAQSITKCIKDTENNGDNKITAEMTENCVTKTLGILQENGIYASFVYMLSRIKTAANLANHKPESHCYIYIVHQLITLLRDPGTQNLGLVLDEVARNETPIKKGEIPIKKGKILSYVSQKLTNTIDDVLIVHKLFEQTLIFARYGAKALKPLQEEGTN
ncbi:hypothetical protein GF312_01620 [Candidatus Poribacteria bacterium]|nr:hypothetical protein [Candidatus Poribacteria bacterium]